MLSDSPDYKSISNYNGLVVYNMMESHAYPCPLYSDPIFKQRSSRTRRMGNQYSVVGIIRLGGVESNIQYSDQSDYADQNPIFNSLNGRIRRIGIQYSIVRKVGLAGLES